MSSADCHFCQIVLRRKENSIVYEDDRIIAFLDIRPVFKGHTLVTPKVHHENFYELKPGIINHLFREAQRISQAVEKAMAADGTFLCINNKVSQSVPHCHLHIIPRKHKDGLRGFLWPRFKVNPEEMRLIKNKIRAALRSKALNK
jgi:histidine triad (HIT) family protein